MLIEHVTSYSLTCKKHAGFCDFPPTPNENPANKSDPLHLELRIRIILTH